MFDVQFPHHGTIIHNGIAFDRMGIGGADARPSSSGAAWVMMKPTMFLSLATKLHEPRPSLEWIRGRISCGDAISPPELTFRMPDGFLPAVSSHEGRHRMTALLELGGDVDVPVRIVLSGMDHEDITPSLMARIRPRARAQRNGIVVDGPLFGEAVVDLGGLITSGIPPPICAWSGSRLDRPVVSHSHDRCQVEGRFAILVSVRIFGTCKEFLRKLPPLRNPGKYLKKANIVVVGI